jgi:glycosyltransferase involved in cell wall biosynthesis
MKKPLRVLMISNMYPNAEDPGYGIYVYEQVEEIRKLGVTLDLLVTDRKARTPVQKLEKYVTHFCNAWRFWRSTHDVVHLHFPAAPHLLAATPVLLFSGIPYVVTIHRGELQELPAAGPARWLVSKFLRRAARVIAVSRDLADLAERELGVDGNRLEVINVGFNGDLFSPRDAGERREVRRKLGFSDERFSLLFVGTIEPRKGLTTLFEALDRLSPTLAVELFIVGIGPSEDELKAIAHRHRLRDHIHWLGVVTHDRLPDLYAAADAFVLPSHSEGTPTVLLETMAMGTPAIITRVGGVPDVVQHAENGLLFEPGDATTLARLIDELASDDHLRSRIADKALSDVQGHSLRRQVGRIEEIYHTVRKDTAKYPRARATR